MRSKSQKKIVFAEANGDFADFMFSFLTVPLGSIVKLLGANSFVGCVDNLYKSVETMESSWCTDSRTVLLNPGVAPQFGCPNQPLDLNIPDVEVELPTYYYGIGTPKRFFDYDYFCYRTTAETIEGGVISKLQGSIYEARPLTELDPRSPDSSKEGVVGFVKRPALYGVGDDLKVKPLSAISCHSYLKELSLPLDDLEVMKVISIGEAEVSQLLLLNLSFAFLFLFPSIDLFDHTPLWCRL